MRIFFTYIRLILFSFSSFFYCIITTSSQLEKCIKILQFLFLCRKIMPAILFFISHHADSSRSCDALKMKTNFSPSFLFCHSYFFFHKWKMVIFLTWHDKKVNKLRVSVIYTFNLKSRWILLLAQSQKFTIYDLVFCFVLLSLDWNVIKINRSLNLLCKFS